LARFKGNRYLTRGIQSEVGLAMQIILWSLIDQDVEDGKEMDYLQVFILKPSADNFNLQRIEQRQEMPDRLRVVSLDAGEPPISAKIFVIDSGEYSTMMLSNEY